MELIWIYNRMKNDGNRSVIQPKWCLSVKVGQMPLHGQVGVHGWSGEAGAMGWLVLPSPCVDMSFQLTDGLQIHSYQFIIFFIIIYCINYHGMNEYI